MTIAATVRGAGRACFGVAAAMLSLALTLPAAAGGRPAGTAAGGSAAIADPAVTAAASEPVASAATAQPWPKESVEADVATRSVAVTSGFSGSQVVVFGTVENSRQSSAEAGLYDVVVVIEGGPQPVTIRRKSRVGGIWVNTAALDFDSVPGYYAIASTRPLDEIADRSIFIQNGIGFDHVTMVPARKGAKHLTGDAIEGYRDAVVELKRRQKLYFEESYGVAFIGRSLFRSTLTLPGNVPVGPLTARVFLLREGMMLASFTAHVDLAREGIERALYDLAMNRPVLYGLSAILVAIGAGLAAAAFFNRARA